MSVFCRKCHPKKWYPNSVGALENILETRINATKGVANAKQIRKNIAYNLQYLEFITVSVRELNLSDVIRTQTYKTFILIGVSICEAIFYFIIKEKKVNKSTEWESLKKTETQEFKIGMKNLKIENELFQKLDVPIDVDMPFDSMIKKIESRKLLGVKHKLYGDLKYLKRLRNKIHIHDIKNPYDTDWYNFKQKDFNLMEKILHDLLTSNIFSIPANKKSIFDFLIEKTDGWET